MCSCTNVEHRAYGIYRCTFKKREDHLKKQVREGKIHTCHFEKEAYSKILETHFIPEKPKSTVVTYDDIMTKVSIDFRENPYFKWHSQSIANP